MTVFDPRGKFPWRLSFEVDEPNEHGSITLRHRVSVWMAMNGATRFPND